jgi:uncharacterized membrane protein
MGSPIGVVAQEMSYSGPVPPSSELRAHEEILPGAADRIITMAEKEQDHRHSSGKKFLHNDRIRIIGAIVVSLGLLAAAVYALYLDRPLLAAALGGMPILAQGLRMVLSWLSDRGSGKKD